MTVTVTASAISGDVLDCLIQDLKHGFRIHPASLYVPVLSTVCDYSDAVSKKPDMQEQANQKTLNEHYN